MKDPSDITGWQPPVAIRAAGRDRFGHSLTRYRCNCGSEFDSVPSAVRAGRTKSCGCLKAKRISAWAKANLTKHGMKGTAEWKAWIEMKRRCRATDRRESKSYHKKGIKVCLEWENSFLAFLSHIGPRPTADHSVDRIKNDKGYEPGNVRWATSLEQNRNRDSTKRFTIAGTTKTLAEWAAEHGVSYRCVYSRLRRGLSITEALNTREEVPQ